MKSSPTMHTGSLGSTVRVLRADAGKVERCAEMRVRELWRLHGRTGSEELQADFLAQ